MSKVAIDCPICLTYKPTRTNFRMCGHAVCGECAYEMLKRNIQLCPICREVLELGLIPDTIIVIDECYEKKAQLKPKETFYMRADTAYYEPEETKYYDADDSDYDSDNDGMN